MAQNEFVSLSNDVSFDTEYIGNEKQPVLTVDNYVARPDVLRKFAIKTNQFTAAGRFYPGIRMGMPQSYGEYLIKNLADHMSSVFGLNAAKIIRLTPAYSIVTKQPDKLQPIQKIPHFDSPNSNSLAILHYLCDEAYSGTAFYRHKASQFEYIDNQRLDGYMKTVNDNLTTMEQHSTAYIADSNQFYEQIASREVKFNRLLMYKATSLHSGIIPENYSYDPNPATGRLTITSFIEFAA